MANEIEIKITVDDQGTAVIKKFQSTLEEGSKQVQKQTTKTSTAFDDQMGSLIVLGQAANTVNNIFDSYSNLQLKLENAAERVTGAQDRLREAQYKLSKTQKDTASTSEDIANAQANVDSASRGLTISMNNLARANSKVLDTYISMGIQSLTLIAQGKVLMTSLQGLIQNFTGLKVSTMALTASTIGLGTALAAIVYFNGQIAQQRADYASRSEEMLVNNAEQMISWKNLASETWAYAGAIDGVRKAQLDMVSKKSKEELQAEYDIAQAKLELRNKDLTELERVNLNSLINNRQKKVDELTLLRERNIAFTELQTVQAESEKGLIKSVENFQSLSYTEQLKDLKERFMPEVEAARQTLIANEQARLDTLVARWNELIRLQMEYYAKEDARSKVKSAISSIGSLTPGGIVANAVSNFVSGPKKNDFVMRPGQGAVSFSPDDTLIGTKGGLGGTTIIISGDNYGVDPKQISEAIMKQLRQKIAI
jgi:hypothetical protein